jgi:hypothetical protein
MTIIQHKAGEVALDGDVAITLDSPVTAGSTLILVASVYNNSGDTGILTGTSTVGGSPGNTWVTRQNSQSTGTTNSVHIATADGVSAGTTVVTATITGSTSPYLTAHVIEMGVSDGYDVSAKNDGTGTAATTGTTAAQAQNSNTVFIVFGSGNDNNLATASGFTTLRLQNSNATYQPIYAAYKDVNASGTESASITLAGSDTWAGAIAVIKTGSGGTSAALTGSAMTSGIGTVAPGLSIGL